MPGRIDLASLHEAFIDALDDHRWAELGDFFASKVLTKYGEVDREALLDLLKAEGEDFPQGSCSVDFLVCNKSENRIAARLRWHRETRAGEDTDTDLDRISHVFYGVANGRIDKYLPTSSYEAPDPAPPVLAHPHSRLSAADIEANYHKYISAVNNRTMDRDFPHLCQEQLLHNSVRLTCDQYQRLIKTSLNDIAGLQFGIKELVVDEKMQRIGALIELTGRPAVAVGEVESSGKDVTFTQPVFYQLKDGKMDVIWILIDFEAYKKSTSG